MANRRQQMNSGGRRMDFGRNDRAKNFGGRTGPPVSPWQGNAPTGGLNSLLPLGGNSTEATLALANNLISNLLQQRQSPVPSLLDMPIRRDFGGNMDGPRYDRQYNPQRMGNQGNFRRPGNYGNNNRDRNSNNRRPFRPNDGPRHANKNTPRKDSDNKPRAAKSETTPKKEMEKEVEVKIEPKSEETPQETSETSESTTEKTKDDGKQKEKKKTQTPYDDINQAFLKCHICNKSMWDGRSFLNHINGRAHAIMMQKTAESYALTADTMRQELKIREMKRTRRAGKQSSRDFYCAMCDMYAAEGAAHRTTVGHRKLKKYLHPNCSACHKEMPTRIELDEHRLTPEHLKNISQKSDGYKPKTEIMVISTLAAEQSYVREDRNQKKKPAADVKKEGEDKETDGEDKEIDGEAQDEELAVGDGDVELKAEDEVKKENGVDEVEENTVVDYKEGDDMSQVTAEMLPQYSTTRPVARSFLTEFKCIQCTLCKRLLDNEETAEVHLKTWRHHLNFVKLVKDKAGLIKRDDRKRRAANDESSESEAKKVKSEVADETADGGQSSDAIEHGDENGEDLNDGDEILNDDALDNDNDIGGGEWESTVDEILKDETNDDIIGDSDTYDNDSQIEQEPEPEPEPVEVKEEPPKTPTAKRGRPTATRGRARGRGRRGN